MKKKKRTIDLKIASHFQAISASRIPAVPMQFVHRATTIPGRRGRCAHVPPVISVTPWRAASVGSASPTMNAPTIERVSTLRARTRAPVANAARVPRAHPDVTSRSVRARRGPEATPCTPVIRSRANRCTITAAPTVTATSHAKRNPSHV